MMTTRIMATFNSRVEDLVARRDEEALEYLRAKFPNLDKKIFRTDYTGRVGKHVVDAVSVYKARKYKQICASCQGVCALPEERKSVISVGTAGEGLIISVWAG